MRGSSTNLTFLESLVPGQHDRRSTVRHLAQASTDTTDMVNTSVRDENYT